VKALLNAWFSLSRGQMIFDISIHDCKKETASNIGARVQLQVGAGYPQDIQQLEPKLELIKGIQPSETVTRFPDSSLWGPLPRARTRPHVAQDGTSSSYRY